MNETALRKFCGQLGIPLSQYQTFQGWIEAPCPLAPWTHPTGRDARPSFAVCVNDAGYSAYKCQTCHQQGTITRLAIQLSGFREDGELRQLANEIQVQEIRGFTPLDWDEDTPARPMRAAEVAANADLYPSFIVDPFARAYLQARSITVGTALALGLRADTERGRVLFPVYDHRRVFRGFTGRAIELPDTPVSTLERWEAAEHGNRPKVRDYMGLPKRALLLGEHQVLARPGSRIVLVEGLFAFALFRQYGIKNVVALLGSAPTPEKAETLLRWDRPVVCFLDNDEAGQRGIHGYKTPEGKPILGLVDFLYPRIPLLLPRWPAGVTDPDDLTSGQAHAAVRHADVYAA